MATTYDIRSASTPRHEQRGASSAQLARRYRLTLEQVARILGAGEFTRPERTLAEDLAALAADVGATPRQVQAVLEAA
jgi:hypothetical protein